MRPHFTYVSVTKFSAQVKWTKCSLITLQQVLPKFKHKLSAQNVAPLHLSVMKFSALCLGRITFEKSTLLSWTSHMLSFSSIPYASGDYQRRLHVFWSKTTWPTDNLTDRHWSDSVIRPKDILQPYYFYVKHCEPDIWAQCYKTSFVHNLRTFVISWSVFPWQAFQAYSNKYSSFVHKIVNYVQKRF